MTRDHAWSGLKPSRARAVDAGGRPYHHHQPHQAGSSSLRGSEWAPAWELTPNAHAPGESWKSPWSGALPCHPATTNLSGAQARRKGLATDLSMSIGGRGAGLTLPGQSLQQEPPPHREGWKRSLISSPRGGTDQRLHRFGSCPCSELILDAEMDRFESEITRTVSDYLSSLPSESQASRSPTENGGNNPVAAASSLEKRPSLKILKRKQSGFSETLDDVQGDCGWIPPLKLMVRKGLTSSDVGELNRIIIPKKDAESPSFPQIHTKEGAVLQMEDYSALKRWQFRFKYWTNNKSRIYVLENTGDFVRYHSLSEHDLFIVYEDVSKNLVVCGQKKARDDNLLDDVRGSASETTPASAIKDEPVAPPTSS